MLGILYQWHINAHNKEKDVEKHPQPTKSYLSSNLLFFLRKVEGYESFGFWNIHHPHPLYIQIPSIELQAEIVYRSNEVKLMREANCRHKFPIKYADINSLFMFPFKVIKIWEHIPNEEWHPYLSISHFLFWSEPLNQF